MTSDKKSRVENGTVRRGKPCAEHVEGLGDVMMKHNKKVVDYIGVVSNPIKTSCEAVERGIICFN